MKFSSLEVAAMGKFDFPMTFCLNWVWEKRFSAKHKISVSLFIDLIALYMNS